MAAEVEQLVLSLFPGIGLLDMAFEEEGFAVVRGPDLLWGGDIQRFHVMPGRFDGVIGGPPCQAFSRASRISGTEKPNLIPEFVRVVREAAPSWIVMENVTEAIGHQSIPTEWFVSILRDWDCGGQTSRRRAFWTWPHPVLVPPRLNGKPAHPVMATTWKRGRSDSKYVAEKAFLPGDRPLEEYARLQGVPEIGERLMAHRSSKAFAVTVLGNGVPLPMGRVIARAVKRALEINQ